MTTVSFHIRSFIALAAFLYGLAIYPIAFIGKVSIRAVKVLS